MLRYRKTLFIAAALSFVLVPFLGPVLGDGMAFYPSYVKDKDELEELYGSTYESRQLANVVLLDDDQQRIDLFLSLFSLKPGNNMTLLVPFRELPTDVKVEQMKDRDFLDSIGYSRIKMEADKQDLGKNMGRLSSRTGDWLQRGVVSASFTPIAGIGLYIEDNYELSYSGRGKGLGFGDSAGSLDENGDDTIKKKEVEKIDTYDFDGVSISVYSVSENATMEDFTEGIELEGLPQMTKETLEEYKGHYAVTIDSETVPPIDPDEYAMMNALMPGTMGEWTQRIKAQPKVIDEYIVHDMVQELSYLGFKEIHDTGDDLAQLSELYGKVWRPQWDAEEWLNDYRWDRDYHFMELISPGSTPFDIMKDLSDITYTVYGFTPFNGTVISVTTSLDVGNIYFPLGTSDSWSNPIAHTVVVVKMDKGMSFDPNIVPDAKAFIDGDRYYLFDFPMDNPEDDLHGSIGSTRTMESFSAAASEAVYGTYSWVSVLIALLLYLLFWFLLLKASYLLLGATRDGKRCKALTGRNLLFALLAMLITAPGVHLLFRKDDQGTDKGSEDTKFNRSHAVHSIVMLSLGVLFLLMAVV